MTPPFRNPRWPTDKFARWQTVTVGTLLVGYAGYYLCRSNLSVAANLLIADFKSDGFGNEQLGMISSFGIAFYTLGKLFNGVLCDFLGGRRMFLFGMVGSVACTVWFGIAEGTAFFVAIWSLNRLVQSMGWGALVKVAARWFPVQHHGTIMGVLALSYLFGDTLSRVFLGQLIAAGVTWRGLFFISAAVLATIALISSLTLKASPGDVGHSEPHANPHNVFGSAGNQPTPLNLRELLAPYAKSPSFWLVCIISFGLTLIRETFNFWTPVYLKEIARVDDATAATVSSLVPLAGGLSVLAAGWLTDRIAGGSRGKVMFPALALLAIPLIVLSQLPSDPGVFLPIALICATMFLMIGPYSFLTGVHLARFRWEEGRLDRRRAGRFGRLPGWHLVRVWSRQTRHGIRLDRRLRVPRRHRFAEQCRGFRLLVCSRARRKAYRRRSDRCTRLARRAVHHSSVYRRNSPLWTTISPISF